LMIEVITSLIEMQSDLELVGSAGEAELAITLATEFQPDVALLDVKMEGGGARAARAIRSRSPKTEVVAFSAFDDKASVLEMLAAGASGYLVKGASAQDIVDAIRRTASGKSALSVGVTADVIHELVTRLDAERSELERRRRMFERVRRALTDGGLSLAFQPICDIRAGTIVGWEALARFPWGPERPPDAWFEEASQVDLRTDLELAAIRAALTRMDDVPAEGFLSVNLSPDTACSADLLRAIDFAHTPRRLVMEVTEHAPVEDYGRLTAALGALRARGVRLAIDDAGSGFSSLQHILRLAPDFIKLDMALTRDVDNDLARRALAAALISFASEIGAVIIAEGIETEAELDTLRELGVTYGQGYYLARPGLLPADVEGHSSGDSASDSAA